MIPFLEDGAEFTGPLVSIIIPAHNEELFIGVAVDSVLRSLGSWSYEIIVVADACTDQTAEIALGRGAHVVVVERRQISAVRNAGAQEARGQYLIFMDADTQANSAVLEAALDAMQQGYLGGGAGFTFDQDVTWFGRLLEMFFGRFCRLMNLAAGCFMFCTKEALEAVGGFSEEVYAAEEWVFSKAIKRLGPFCILSESVVTSARKFQMFSLGQMIRHSLKAGFNPRRRSPLWYGEQD